jgi:hypothetical protein
VKAFVDEAGLESVEKKLGREAFNGCLIFNLHGGNKEAVLQRLRQTKKIRRLCEKRPEEVDDLLTRNPILAASASWITMMRLRNAKQLQGLSFAELQTETDRAANEAAVADAGLTGRLERVGAVRETAPILFKQTVAERAAGGGGSLGRAVAGAHVVDNTGTGGEARAPLPLIHEFDNLVRYSSFSQQHPQLLILNSGAPAGSGGAGKWWRHCCGGDGA